MPRRRRSRQCRRLRFRRCDASSRTSVRPGPSPRRRCSPRPTSRRANGRRTRSVPEVIAAVERGDADGGVVPIENMIEGSVSVTLDTLAFDSELLIQREIDLPVSLNLCAPPGRRARRRAHGRVVPARDRAVPGLARRRSCPAAETAGVALHLRRGAARSSKSKRTDLAAICNALAAELYGLEVLATEIEDHPENQTRFVLVGRGVPAPTGHDKTSIVCFQREDRPGSLLAILQEFAARDDQPHQARVAADQARPRRLLLLHRLRGPHRRRGRRRRAAQPRRRSRPR